MTGKADTSYMDPYQNPDHKRWVARGYCPVISYAKAWCNLRAGHSGDHMSPCETGTTAVRMWWDKALPRA